MSLSVYLLRSLVEAVMQRYDLVSEQLKAARVESKLLQGHGPIAARSESRQDGL